MLDDATYVDCLKYLPACANVLGHKIKWTFLQRMQDVDLWIIFNDVFGGKVQMYSIGGWGRRENCYLSTVIIVKDTLPRFVSHTYL